MKPVFKEEKQTLERLLNKQLPDNLWRKAHALYLDLDSKDPLYRFRVDNGKVVITKDNSDKLKNYKQKDIMYYIESNKDLLDNLYKNSIQQTRYYILNNPDVHQYVLGYSSGKDSIMIVYIWLKTLTTYPETLEFIKNNNIKWEIQMANTSNDTAETYLNVKKTLPEFISEFGFGVKLNIYSGQELKNSTTIYDGEDFVNISIYNPEVGFYNWIKYEKDYFVPSVMVRNCCSTYKEGETRKIYPNDKKVVIVAGVRRFESRKRSQYTFLMDSKKRLSLFSKDSYPSDWVQIAPIVDWKDEEIWMFILREDIPFNPMYRMGYHRVGCLICPFQQDYIDKITQENYPKQWSRWEDILEVNYSKKKIGERLKWDFDEWKNGKWKQGMSKIYEITKLKKTPERIAEVSDILNTTDNIAAKYFDQNCRVCNKKLNPTEIAMFLKLYGRYENTEDNREYLCKKHIIEDLDIDSKTYNEKVMEFTNSGCDLF